MPGCTHRSCCASIAKRWDKCGTSVPVGGTVSQSVEAQQFAAFMRMFKNRIDRSYEALAQRTGISSSSLHRYCNGTNIPASYGVVHRFARECGATQPELNELHRRWTLADAHRRGRPEPAVEQMSARRSATPPPRVPRLAFVGAGVLVLLTSGIARWVRSAPGMRRRASARRHSSRSAVVGQLMTTGMPALRVALRRASSSVARPTPLLTASTR